MANLNTQVIRMLLDKKECSNETKGDCSYYIYSRAIALFTFLTTFDKIDWSLNLQLFTEVF